MKGYRRFITAFVLLLVLYVLAEANRPKELDWSVNLSQSKKSPYGTYILYQHLKELFPVADINTYRTPVYDQVNNSADTNTAYILIEPDITMGKDDLNELLNYVVSGNYVFMAAGNFSKTLTDTLRFSTGRRFEIAEKDSAGINFSSPHLRAAKDYRFTAMTLDGYFKEIDTLHSIVLGSNTRNEVNYIKIPYGDGAFFIHTVPLGFSNHFMLTGSNHRYASTALSYLPRNVKKVYWDEYYKLGPEAASSPFRFILSNTWLRWSFRIGIVAMLLFVFFEMKRRQRIIPIIERPRNTTLDFVQTVGNLYFNQRDNKNMALKKINYFLEYVRSQFYLSTNERNENFVQLLAKKSGVAEEETRQLLALIDEVSASSQVHDKVLLMLNIRIDSFYEKAK